MLVKDELITNSNIKYLKKYEPIGCRDTNTMNILTAVGIKAYFSGCMTLTLGKKYHNLVKDEATYIVDPIISVDFGIKSLCRSLCIFVKHPLDVISLLNKNGLHLYDGGNKLKKIVKTALYYKAYSKIFSHDIIMNSVYIHHYVDKNLDDIHLLNEAERLVKLYAKAKLVITSRIHCALPCLGLETPVIFLKEKNEDYISSCRFGGIDDFFNIIEISKCHLQPKFKMNSIISSASYPKNMENWKAYARELDKRCTNFIVE